MPSVLRKQKDEKRKKLSREQLESAALTVFSRHGFHKTLISDIVAEAGVGQGTFYRHFKSKNEIFEALLDRFIEGLFAKFYDMSTHLPTSQEEYRNASVSAILRVAKAVDANREVSLLFIREAQTIDEGMAAKVASFYDRFAQLAKFYLDHAVEGGFARRCDSGVVSQCLVGIAIRLIGQWFNGNFSLLTLEALVREVVDFAFMGFGVPRNQKRAGKCIKSG